MLITKEPSPFFLKTVYSPVCNVCMFDSKLSLSMQAGSLTTAWLNLGVSPSLISYKILDIKIKYGQSTVKLTVIMY